MNIVFSFSKPKRWRGAAAAVAVLLAAAGCSASGSADGAVSVVASTNVWADVAEQVAGDRAGHEVTVKAIIADAAADPHSYEVSTRDELAIKRADVIIQNGGGYDPFVATMRSAADAKGTVLDAVRVSGHEKVDGELNEHVWYDFPAVAKVAGRLAELLAAKDPAGARTFRANARAFGAKLRGLEAREAAVKARFHGTGVAITEPVPAYLLDACGLVDRTPPAFSKAVEDEQDVSVRVVRQTHALFEEHQVRLLVYNAQTSGPQTEKVEQAAKDNAIAVVPVTETLPTGKDYLTWMSDTLTALNSALA
jgi:zinc/manganese transport system substrate-binding protein